MRTFCKCLRTFAQVSVKSVTFVKRTCKMLDQRNKKFLFKKHSFCKIKKIYIYNLENYKYTAAYLLLRGISKTILEE